MHAGVKESQSSSSGSKSGAFSGVCLQHSAMPSYRCNTCLHHTKTNNDFPHIIHTHLRACARGEAFVFEAWAEPGGWFVDKHRGVAQV